jgi:hypothetical protein
MSAGCASVDATGCVSTRPADGAPLTTNSAPGVATAAPSSVDSFQARRSLSAKSGGVARSRDASIGVAS